MAIEFKDNLTEIEFKHAVKKYEDAHLGYWMPTRVPEQTLWIAAFEQAKLYFKKDNQ